MRITHLDILRFYMVLFAFVALALYGLAMCGCAAVETEDLYTIRGDGERLYFEREFEND